MKKLKILIDLDDTMEDFLPRWVQSINYKYNKDVKVMDIHEWDIHSIYPDLTYEELLEPLQTIEFWEGVQAKPDAPKYIRLLQKDGHVIRVVTSSHYTTLDRKIDCMLFRLFPFLSWDDVVVTQDKGQLKGDVLIDDNPAFMDGFDGVKLLMDAPHNQLEHTITRVYDWKEIYDIISSLAEES